MVGEKLGSFRIEGTLGVGAMGVVYKATHETTGRPAAVKVVNKDIAQRGKTYERFKREAEILKQFRHANIVRFLALGRYQGTSYIAMEFIEGETLEQLLTTRGSLPWQEVVELGLQICDALHYAHEHGVVHRDLKPSNLMITKTNRVKLTDFGIAKDLDKTALTATGRTLGTAAYMAPEQIRGTPEVSHKTDLYALGVVFYQMLTGQAPFEGTSAVVLMHCHLNEPVPRPARSSRRFRGRSMTWWSSSWRRPPPTVRGTRRPWVTCWTRSASAPVRARPCRWSGRPKGRTSPRRPRAPRWG